MSYQKKYYFSFKDIRLVERTHLVELWQNTGDTLTAEEVKSTTPPFIVEMPELDHKFQVVRGSGCTINLLSDTDMKFYAGLYHVDPTEFLVKHYINGTLNWIGYLNSEMITEPYDINFNYPVSVTGNDGFSLMDRFAFLQTDGTQYTGVKSKFELLQIIFGKINLPWSEYQISLSTTFTGYSGAANSTILHESYINCANFYDEDKKPMTLRGVVDAILAPYGAYIRSEGTVIYITDIHNIATNSSITYKRFTYSTGAYVADVVVSNEKAISDIGYIGTGQSIELSGGKNRQVVAYSPYPQKEILNDTLISASEFTTVPGTFSTKDGYYYKTVEDNKFWEIDLAKQVNLNPTTFESSYAMGDTEENATQYLRMPIYGGLDSVVAAIKYNPFLSISPPSITVGGSDFIKLKFKKAVGFLITGEVLVKTKLNPYNTYENRKDVNSLVLSMRIKVGDKYYGFGMSGFIWDTGAVNYVIPVTNEQKTVFADEWTALGANGQGQLIIAGNTFDSNILSGNFEFEIWSEVKNKFYGSNTEYTNDSRIKEIWLRNISIKLVNFDGTEISDDDVEYIALLDKKYSDEGEKISLVCGSDSQYTDNGKIMKLVSGNYQNIISWTRGVQSYSIEELLLSIVSSNYRAGFVKLYGMKLKAEFEFQNILTDTFIGAKKLMVNSAIIDYRDDKTECSLIEITPDELTIVRDATVF